jgi:hypothetical protein
VRHESEAARKRIEERTSADETSRSGIPCPRTVKRKTNEPSRSTPDDRMHPCVTSRGAIRHAAPCDSAFHSSATFGRMLHARDSVRLYGMMRQCGAGWACAAQNICRRVFSTIMARPPVIPYGRCKLRVRRFLGVQIRMFRGVVRTVVVTAHGGQLDPIDELHVGAFIDVGRMTGGEVGHKEPKRTARRRR